MSTERMGTRAYSKAREQDERETSSILDFLNGPEAVWEASLDEDKDLVLKSLHYSYAENKRLRSERDDKQRLLQAKEAELKEEKEERKLARRTNQRLQDLLEERESEIKRLRNTTMPSGAPAQSIEVRELRASDAASAIPTPSPAPSSESALLGSSVSRAKIPDPPLLSDGKSITIESWLLKMRGKLRSMAAQMPTEEDKIDYVFSRVEGLAQKHLEPRMLINNFTNASEM